MFERHGIHLSDKTVGKLLRSHGYSLQAPREAVEGAGWRRPRCSSIEAWWKQVGHRRYPNARAVHHSHPREPLPAGHEQVEQGRASALLFHLHQLARATAALLRDGHQSHRQYNQSWWLVVRARLDRRNYPTGEKVSAKKLSSLKIERETFHGDWNYVIRPRALSQ